MSELTLLFQALSFGIAVAFILVGLIGILIPIMPGTLLIWLTVLAYAIVERFSAIDIPSFIIITLVALVSGTADIWMTMMGAKSGGASRRSMFLGVVGGILGFIFLSPIIPIIGSIVGGILGYALGVLLGQYHKHRDWKIALRAGVGGLAGWGIATAIEIGGGIIILLIFVWQALQQ